MSSIPRAHVKSQAWGTHAWNPRIGEPQIRAPLRLSGLVFSLLSESQIPRETILKQINKQSKATDYSENTSGDDLWPLHVCAQTFTDICTHTGRHTHAHTVTKKFD